MFVVFTMNGQVQGHFTNEFTTRSLKFTLKRPPSHTCRLYKYGV